MPIVGTAVATAIFGAGAAGTFAFLATEALVNLALGVGLQIAGNLLTKQKKQPVLGANLQIQTGGVVPRSLLFGHSATAGSLVYANVWGKVRDTPNAYVSMVVAVADKRCGTPTEVWINDTKCAWPDMSGTAPTDQGWPLAEFHSKKGSDYAWVRWHDGSQATADNFLTDKFGSDTHYPWASTAVGDGVAYAVLTFRYNTSYFSGSLPSVKFVTPGCYWYDPRKDGSVGGTGAQRWNDESTWATTNNPAVHLYNILRGVSYGGKWLYGLQDMVAARLPNDSWFAAMNECDVAVTQTDSTTLPQYQAGGEVPVATTPADAVNALLTACAGRLSEVAGVYKLHVGAPGTAVMTFGDADIISTESQTYNPFPSISETINAITGKYPEPASAWASTDAPPLYNVDYETADGDRELPSDVSYDMVPYKEQVQRLMKSALAEARRFRQVTYVLPAWARALEPGDYVSVTDTRNGFDTKLFRADDLKYLSSLDVQVTLTEVDPSDYDWTAADDYIDVVPVPPTLVIPAAQEFIGWSVYKTSIKDGDGGDRRPAIGVEYPGQMADVQFVRVQVRLSGATALQFDGTVPYGDPEDNNDTEDAVISFASILPATAYEVRGILVPYSNRTALWSNETLSSGGAVIEGVWFAVTTDDIRFGRDDIYDGIIDVKALASDLKDLQENFASSIRTLSEQIAQVALGDADGQFGAYQDVQASYQKVIAQTGNLSAAVEQAIAAATGPDSALATAITALNASDTEGNVADATFQISTNYTAATGWDSKIGMQVRTGHTGTFADAGFFMEAKDDGTTRILMDADSIVMVNGAYAAQPFVFTAGVLTLQAANIGTVTAGLLRSADSKMQIQLDNGRILVAD